MPAKSRIPPAKRERNDWYAAFLVWLGQEAHRKKQYRTPTPVLRSTREPLVNALNALYPWSVRDYPGKWAMLAHILTLKPVTAERYSKPGITIPQKHRDRMAAFLSAKIAALQTHVTALKSARTK